MILALAVGLGSSCSDKGTDGETGDKTPPTVQTILPVDSASNVEITTTIQVTFSEPVDTDDLNTAVFSIQPIVAVSFSRVSNTITITPISDLDWETTYSINISTALSDTAGNDLVEAFEWSFTTMPDPNAAPPEVIGQWPAPGAVGVMESVVISATFTKPMDLSSLQTAFAVAGVSGTVGYLHPVATFIPDDTWDFNTTYNVAITTAAKDTFDIQMAARVSWSFTTRANPGVPVVSWIIPQDSTIIDDTISVGAQVIHPTGVDSTRFFVNGNYVETSTIGALFLFDASLLPIGVGHRLHAVSYADTLVGYSDTLIIFHEWELLDDDFGDAIPGIPQDLERVYYRTTDSILEFRFEFSARWNDPVNDTALNLAIFFDTDQSESTGRLGFGGHDLNDIGAEFRAIMGIDSDSAFCRYNPDSTPPWDSLFGLGEFSGVNFQWDTTMLEFGLRWLDLNNTSYIDLIAVNAFAPDPDSRLFDWSPNEGAGHHTIKRANRYLGTGVITPPAAKLRTGGVVVRPPNPFN